jgi:tRNA-2-methylthio-N6-dimethylallyladenosine synthase
LIVGFPTETEEDFQETIQLLDRMQFDNIYAFAYSPRPGTRAAKLPDDVPADVKNRRLNKLLQHQLKIAKVRYADRIGRVMEILVEGESKQQKMVNSHGSGQAGERVWMGRTECNRVVNFVHDSPRSLTGRFVNVKIVGATSLSLQGELVDHDALFAEQPGLTREYTSGLNSEVVG